MGGGRVPQCALARIPDNPSTSRPEYPGFHGIRDLPLILDLKKDARGRCRNWCGKSNEGSVADVRRECEAQNWWRGSPARPLMCVWVCMRESRRRNIVGFLDRGLLPIEFRETRRRGAFDATPARNCPRPCRSSEPEEMGRPPPPALTPDNPATSESSSRMSNSAFPRLRHADANRRWRVATPWSPPPPDQLGRRKRPAAATCPLPLAMTNFHRRPLPSSAGPVGL
jgi:hypothetical protein